VWDADGRSYVDYVGSWGPLILGHAPAAAVRAAERALRKGSSFGAPTEAEHRLAEKVKNAFPSLERMRFVSSGTEACMSALRLARGHAGRPLVVKFAGGYHGHSDGMLTAAGSGALSFGRPDSAGVPDDVARLTLVLPYNDADALRRAFRKRGRKIAAVIAEPVAANMGVVAPSEDFLSALQDVPREHGALLIFDEVVTGFRLALGGAQSLFGVRPDLTCLGKILGGGFPAGAFGGRSAVMKKLAPEGPVYQAGTLSGNPVAMAAGAAVLRSLEKTPPYRRLAAGALALAEGLRRAARRRGVAVTVNQVGSMFTVFFTDGPVTDLDSAKKSDARLYARFFHGLLKRGVYFPPAQFEAAFVSAAHGPGHIEETLRAADAAFRSL
jgi:glutamate-1-semialdehyde 2,1-aminomutase